MINFVCSKCGKAYSVDDGLAGKTGKCKPCGATLTIPKSALQSPSPAAANENAQTITAAPDATKPKPGTKKSGLLLVGLVAGGLAVCVLSLCCTGTLWFGGVLGGGNDGGIAKRRTIESSRPTDSGQFNVYDVEIKYHVKDRGLETCIFMVAKNDPHEKFILLIPSGTGKVNVWLQPQDGTGEFAGDFKIHGPGEHTIFFVDRRTEKLHAAQKIHVQPGYNFGRPLDP